MLKKIKKFLTPLNILIFLILLAAFFVRVYRIDQLLSFNYDQGRDALVIWDFIHKHKFFLIGPTTGIEGIFRGPWCYWLLIPFYWLGKGNPVYPSVFLSFTVAAALFLLYKLAKEVGGQVAGIIAVTIGGASFYLVLAGRWLSNPTPMFLISMGLVYSLFKILDKKSWAWPLLSLCLGMSMQFGSAAEVFYFPAVAIVMFWKKLWPTRNVLIVSVLVFLLILTPQAVFDFRHGRILTGNIANFLFSGGSFKASFWQVIKIRSPFYLDVFGSKIFPSDRTLVGIFAVLFAFLVFLKRKILFAESKFTVVSIIFVTPMIGMLFFQGNYGNVYDYYFTGYYLVFVLVFASVLGAVWKSVWGKILIFIFLALFLKDNLPLVRNYIISGVDGSTTIAFGNQKLAIDWIYTNANGRDFNVDEYVPPVIPYSYNYLFKWLGSTKYKKLPAENLLPLLYTLYEVDPPHPERLEAWLKRQGTIGKIKEEAVFGGITVQKRLRY